MAAAPRVQYTYDQGGANSVGHLSKVEAFGQSLTSYGNFDALGRPGQSYQNTNATPYTMLYTYNLAGGLTSETYPSGRTISTGYDAANRVTQMGGVLNGQPTSYVASVSYQPHGGPFKMEYGNQLWRTYTYNQRLQVSGLWDALQDMPSQFLFLENPIGWGGTDNNGTVRNLTLYAGGPGPSSALFSFQQTFAYDGVKRLQSVTDTGGWSRGYSYDQFGNRAVTNPVGLSANQAPQSFTGANQVSGGSYDAAGNQLAVGGNGLEYDGENRVSQITEPPGGAQLTYYYDGEGRRIEKLVNGVPASVYVYDALGQMIAEDSPNQSTGTAPCRTCYLSVDHLGSPRLITDASGHVMALHDYLPFGDEVPANLVGRDGRWGPGNDNIQQKFTGQERGETGLDYFGARYYAGALGRFTSPDPENAGADLYNPQSWNGYSYAGNDPLANVDPSGLFLQSILGDLGSFFGFGGGGGGTQIDFSVTGYGVPDASLSGVWFGGGLVFGGGGGGGGRNSGGGGSSTPTFSITHTEPAPVQSLVFVNPNNFNNCVAGYGAAGAGIGTGVGGVAGIGVGSTLGASLGTAVEPLGGTVGGAVLGGRIGGGTGASLGTYYGAKLGAAIGNVVCASSNGNTGGGNYKKPKSGLSGKEAARDAPSWAKGQRPYTGESGKKFAERLLDEKYGPGNYPRGPGSEFNKVQKWGDRGFE